MKDASVKHAESGFTLLEVLVSIIILSIGLLGMAGLLTVSLKSNNTANYRSQATMLADDIMDRMRANLTHARNSAFDVTIGGACTGGGQAIVDWDCEEWKAMIAQSLPSGDASIVVDLNGNVAIVIQWDDGSGATTSFTTNSRL